MFGVKLNHKLLQYFIRKAAYAHGFLDPVSLVAKLGRFAQPSEIAIPTELMRSAAVLHARGLINNQAIQHNLDWVWPYWVERQFNPRDKAFVPRAFSATHINLTHRNWTAVGLPDTAATPIVDPAGLLTPFWDGWSLDGWVIDPSGGELIPARLTNVAQHLDLDDNLRVVTESFYQTLRLESKAEMIKKDGVPVCRLSLTGRSPKGGWLVVALRPYNPEGISFIGSVELLDKTDGWKINQKQCVYFQERPDRYRLSDYHEGDVYFHLTEEETRRQKSCKVEMATAAALFAVEPGVAREVIVDVPLHEKRGHVQKAGASGPERGWPEHLEGLCRVKVPDAQYQFLYDAAVRTLFLHSAEDIFAGPYTYKHFWFRDAAFIAHAFLCLNALSKCERLLNRFLSRQLPSGYFQSQEGEWDSNGQVMWVFRRFCQLTNHPPSKKWLDAVQKGGRWIIRKRLPSQDHQPHTGLMPPGFSAEHLGPNDYYYWDGFWSVEGLRAASYLSLLAGRPQEAQNFADEAKDLMGSIEESLTTVAERLQGSAMPASPYRRLDSGAVGSLAVGYPLQLWFPEDPRVLATAEYLMNNCLVHGGFFHDMSHSGINPYLTLHIAQVLLRSGDRRFEGLMQAVADLASPTGQWPEAIHPATLGGCMGDGQHVWAAAEWILMLRNCFLREEDRAQTLVLCGGIPPQWYQKETEMAFGPAPTSFGPVSLSVKSDGRRLTVRWQARWHTKEPIIVVKFPGLKPCPVHKGDSSVEISLNI